MAQLVIDKIFAENLGFTLGGAARDQVIGLFNREIPRDAGAKLNPLPFLGSRAKNRFKALWLGALQAMAVWAVVETLPEYSEEKLLRKTVFQMQKFVDEEAARTLLAKLSEDEFAEYDRLRRTLTRTAAERKANAADISRTFLEALHGSGRFTAKEADALTRHIVMARGLFVKLVDISVKEPNSYKRPGVPKKK